MSAAPDTGLTSANSRWKWNRDRIVRELDHILVEEKIFKIPSISCNHCVMTVEREIGMLDGVQSVKAEPESKLVTVNWQPPATLDVITKRFGELGCAPEF